MAKTASRWWNKAFGIDPEIPIADSDRNEIEEKYSGDERNRMPQEISVLASLSQFWPLIIFGLGGLGTIYIFRLPFWTAGIVTLVAVAALWHSSHSIAKKHIGPLYRRELRARGYDICVTCGYWLRGLTDDVKHCPECGTARSAEMPQQG